MTVSRKPCIYALVKSVYDSHFDTTEVRDVSLFKSWKAANKAMREDYQVTFADGMDHADQSIPGPFESDDKALARFSYDNPPLENIEVMWDIIKTNTGGLK